MTKSQRSWKKAKNNKFDLKKAKLATLLLTVQVILETTDFHKGLVRCLWYHNLHCWISLTSQSKWTAMYLGGNLRVQWLDLAEPQIRWWKGKVYCNKCKRPRSATTCLRCNRRMDECKCWCAGDYITWDSLPIRAWNEVDREL